MKKTYRRSDALNALILDKLVEVFQELNWDLHNDDRFNRFCNLLSRLKDEEQQLILKLTKSFFYCGLNHYPAAISQVVNKITEALPQNIKEIIAVPLVSPRDVGKVKSGSLLIYLISPELKQVASSKGLKFSNIDRCSELAEKKARRNTFILFVDDFLGSGTTAKEALDEYKQRYRAEDDHVLVATLVAQQKAVNLLKNLGIESVFSYLRTRGISDSDSFPDKEFALTLIDQIEDRLKVRPGFRRGYQQSEALVCMIKCPNNTFPVFWIKNKIDGELWPAPFPGK